MPTLEMSSPAALPADWRDILALTKPRVMSLVVFTAVCGLFAAPAMPPFALGLTAILCIALAAGACGALNQWYEHDLDAKMRRTANRPLPAQRMDRQTALHFGVGLSVFSVVLMDLATNHLAAALLAVSILFYVFIYTVWLKRRTPQNIVIGGAAGAFPPVIGWAAVTGSVDLMPVLLFAIVFFWTPPHFWDLALYASGDYQRAGVPMLPVVSGARTTRLQVLIYTVILGVVSLTPWIFGYAGGIYAVSALGLSLWFLHAAVGVWRDKQDETGVSLTADAPAKWAFRVSLLYLFTLFGALAADYYLWWK